MSSDQQPVSQRLVVRGRGNRVKKFKQKIVFRTSADPGRRIQNYAAKWSLTTPLTQGRLALLSVVLGVLAIIEGYAGFAPLVRNLRNTTTTTFNASTYVPIYVSVGALLLAVVAAQLAHLVKHQLRTLGRFAFLPAVIGVNGRLTVAKFAGRCNRCGGKLRFYAKPTRWVDHYRADGGKYREVTERQLAAECRRNPEHWARIDPAEAQLTP